MRPLPPGTHAVLSEPDFPCMLWGFTPCSPGRLNGRPWQARSHQARLGFSTSAEVPREQLDTLFRRTGSSIAGGQSSPCPLLPDSARCLQQQGQRSRMGNLVTLIATALLSCSKPLIKRITGSLFIIIHYHPMAVEMYTFSFFHILHYHPIAMECLL